MRFATDTGNVWFGCADRRIPICGPNTSVAKQIWGPTGLRIRKLWRMIRQCGKPGWCGLAAAIRLKTRFSVVTLPIIAADPCPLRILTATYVLIGAAVSLYQKRWVNSMKKMNRRLLYRQSQTVDELAHPS